MMVDEAWLSQCYCWTEEWLEVSVEVMQDRGC